MYASTKKIKLTAGEVPLTTVLLIIILVTDNSK